MFSERLRTPWWWYPVALTVAALVAGEFRLTGLNLTVWIPFCVLLPLAMAIVWWLGRARVEVSAGELRIRDAHVPLRLIDGAVSLDARTLRRVVGPEGDPAAFVSIRPWVHTGVQFWLDDPDDPTPYWIVSTRRGDRLAALLRAR